MAVDVKSLEGNEISDYARTAPNSGRWGETWSTFKGSFGKVILINILTLIFCLPSVAILFFRSVYISGMGLQAPVNGSAIYPVYTGTQGLAESIYFSADVLFYSLLIVGGIIASIGISGGAYSIRKLLNTHGKFSLKGFFHGVKVCYFNTVLPVVIFLIFFFCCKIVGDWKNIVSAHGGSTAGPITAYVFIIIATVVIGIYCAWLFAVGISFKLKFNKLFKNAFMLMLGSPLQTLFFAAFSLIPVWLYLIGTAVPLVKIISFAILIFFGLSLIMLIWLSFTQWVFDLYVTPNYQAYQEAEKAKKSPKELAAEQEEDDKRVARELLAAGRSELIGKPILPISEDFSVTPLGLTYNREDFKRLESDRQKLVKDVADYEQAHKNDAVYAEYNRLFAEREKALQDEGKKGKKKKVSAKNLLG